MKLTLRVLIVEDSEDDVLLTIHALKKGGYDPTYQRVEDADALRKALETGAWDVILCDYQMPKFNGLAAIALLKETGIDIPLIIVSGAIGEETAVECMRLGAHDYVMKGNLSRLVPAIKRELKETESRRQRKQAEEALQRSEQQFRLLVENTSEAIVVVQDGRAKFVNRGIEWAGYTPDEYMSIPVMETIHPEDREAVEQRYLKKINGDTTPTRHTYRALEKSGRIHWIEVSSVLIDWKGRPATLNLIMDVTTRKQAEDEAVRVAWEWQTTFDATNDAIWILGEDQTVLRSNKTAEGFFHRPLGEMIGKHCWEIVHGTKQPIPECPILRVRKSLRRETIDLQEGEQWFEVNVDPILDAAGRYSGAVHIVSDITERKRADQEKALLANIGLVIGSTLEIDKVYDRMAAEIRKLIPFDNLMLNICDARQETLHVAYISGLDMPGRMAGDVFPVQGTLAEAVIRTRKGVLAQSENQEDLIKKFPRLIVSVKAGIRSVMSVPLIALDKVIGNLIMRSKKPVAFTEQDLLLSEKIGIQIAGAMANAELFNNLSKTEKALRMSEENYRNLFDNANEAIFVAQDGKLVFINPMTIRLIGHSHDALMSRSFVEFIHPDDRGIVIDRHMRRLKGEDLPHIYSFRIIHRDGKIIWGELNTVAVNWEEKSATLNFLSDVTERKRVEQKLQNTLESLRRAVNTTIQVMVAAVETRDPYTSGHQIRSANLARAIATEMELPSEKIEGIRMAGSIHDIGKLSIPAEILSKPTKLSELEFSLIKEHARKGFEMLKDVESPWPLAEIVYQHHERMDGSGYPRNLKGEEILIEARILNVADVVEAMASHRPYRAGLGIGPALSEIEKNRGIFYDAAAADACLRLFREKGYQLN